MGGKNSGKSTKPRTVAKRYRPGFLSELDGRYPIVRALKCRLGCYAADLGGMDDLSTMQLTVMKRIVHLEHLIERKESDFLRGTVPFDVHEYLSAVNSLCGLLGKIGLKRRARPVTLKDYLTHETKTPAPDPDRPAPSSSQENTP